MPKIDFVNAFNLNSATFIDGWDFPWSNIFYPTEQMKALKLPERLTNPLYGREELDAWINERAKHAPTIERVWEITARFPSLTAMLREDRDADDDDDSFIGSISDEEANEMKAI